MEEMTMDKNVQQGSAADAEQIRDYLKGMPRFNIAALCLPPIWGPAQGLWITILWYPAWMMADNCFYTAIFSPSTLSVIVGVLVFVLLVAATFAFAYFTQPYAAHRAIGKGKTKEEFQKNQRIWAIASVIAGVLMIAFATYYNLCIRVPLS